MESETKEESKEQPKEDLIATVDKLQEQLDRKEKLLSREEELMARRLIGGNSPQVEPEKPKEETDQEYRLRIEKELREGKFN